MTLQEELTLSETALAGLYSGQHQSYTINGKTVTRLNMKELQDRVDYLRAEVARNTVGGIQTQQLICDG